MMRSSSIRPQSAGIVFLLLASAPLAILAYDASQRSCVGDNVCLTSFHRCAAEDLRGDGQTGCSFPDEAYPMTLNENQHNAALLIRGRDYVISWKKGDPKNENPVRITWKFGVRGGGGGGNLTWGPKWETNITGASSSFTFNPGTLLGQFPTELAPDMSPTVASGLAAQGVTNQIVISQAKRTIASNGQVNSEDKSQFFILAPEEVKYFLTVQKRTGGTEMYDRWKLGVGVGVGVGVPLLLLASGFLGWLVGKKAASKRREAISK